MASTSLSTPEPTGIALTLTGNSTKTSADNDNKWQRVRRLISLPYFVGIIWACLHPYSSILTGNFTSPRRYYIDENSLETTYLRSNYPYLVPSNTLLGRVSKNTTFCDSVASLLTESQNVVCHRHGSSFDLVRVVPTGTTMEPSNEAIVLVAPHSSTSYELHVAFLELVQRLASPHFSPWLAKTILLVSPTTANGSLEATTRAFLEAYAGHYYANDEHYTTKTETEPWIEPLPPFISDAMIRTVLVLDGQPSTDPEQPKHEVRILSQGKLGVLPNMDLVFVSMIVFQRSAESKNARMNHADKSTPTMFMHPYSAEARHWESFVKSFNETTSSDVEGWAIRLGNLVLFCRNLLIGPYGPHALALSRGIDAVTIQARYLTTNESVVTSFAADYIQKLEILLHGLSNLHERLHHSTTLYLLPDPKTFVKHEEYLVPNLLLLIPAVLRAAFLGLRDIDRFHLPVMGWLSCITLVASAWMDLMVANIQDSTQRDTWWIVTCASCVWFFHRKMAGQALEPESNRTALQSAQLVSCLLAIYVHVPICFGHVALSYPSAFFWSPWVSLVSFETLYRNKLRILLGIVFLVVSWPPTFLLRMGLLGTDCGPYIRFVCFPLHLVLSLSMVLALVRPAVRTTTSY